MTPPAYTDSGITGSERVVGNVIEVVNTILTYEYVRADKSAWAPEDKVLGTAGVAEGVSEALRELREMRADES